MNIKNQFDILPAIFLKWLSQGKIIFEKTEDKDNKVVAIIFKENISFDEQLELSLYNILKKACVNGRLDLEYFKKWCKSYNQKWQRSNCDEIYSWFDRVLVQEKYELLKDGSLVKKRVNLEKVFFATDMLNEDALHLAGLKRFLQEFSNLETKQSIEVNLWEEYLLYAQLFGIADKVSKEFKRIYPQQIDFEIIDNISEVCTFASKLIDFILATHESQNDKEKL